MVQWLNDAFQLSAYPSSMGWVFSSGLYINVHKMSQLQISCSYRTTFNGRKKNGSFSSSISSGKKIYLRSLWHISFICHWLRSSQLPIAELEGTWKKYRSFSVHVVEVRVCVLLDGQPIVSATRSMMKSQSSFKKLCVSWVERRAAIILQFLHSSFLDTLMGFK